MLIKSTLQAEILSFMAGSNNPTGITNAKALATAIINYWDMGKSNLGGSVISAPGKAIMLPLLLEASQGNKLFSDYANKVATAIDSGLKAIIITGGKHGIGGIGSTVKPVLKASILEYMSQNNTNVSASKKLASAIHDYTGLAQVYGSGVGPDFVPPAGPLQ